MGYHLEKESHCAVIGHGSMATAMMKVLSMNETSVDWYIHNPEVLESLSTEGHNCRYLPDVEFDISRIHLSDDLNEVVHRSDVIFLITPAIYTRDSRTFRVVCAIIDRIKADNELKLLARYK